MSRVGSIHLAILALTAMSAGAQYISQSGTSSLQPIPDRDGFTQKIDDARWTFGAVKVQPWLGLRDASYVTNQNVGDVDEPDSEDSQLTATAGAGLRLYGRASSKLLFTAHVLPEYVWWEDSDDKSGWNGRYGAGMFGFYNRLRFELSHRINESQGFFNPELQLLTSTELQRTRAAVELELSRGITLFVIGRNEDFSGNGDDARIFTLLDRTEERVGAGVRIESARGYWAQVSYEDANLEFEDEARQLGSDERAVVVGLGFERERLQGSLDLGFRELEPTEGSVLQPFDDVTGNVDLLWKPRHSLGLRLFGQRRIDYSIGEQQTLVLGTRVGARAELRPGNSFLQIGYAVGEDEYEAVAGSVSRQDDVTELEAIFRIPLGDVLLLDLRAARLDYDSSLPGLDRDVTRYGIGVELGRILERLQLGSDSGIW